MQESTCFITKPEDQNYANCLHGETDATITILTWGPGPHYLSLRQMHRHFNKKTIKKTFVRFLKAFD